MDKTLMTGPSHLPLSAHVAAEHSACTWQDAVVHGTGVSVAGTSLAGTPGTGTPVIRTAAVCPDRVARDWTTPASAPLAVPAQVVSFVGGARSTDLPGLPPRGAPV